MTFQAEPAAGVGITAIGPGGIFLTTAPLALSGLPPAGVAGLLGLVAFAAGAVILYQEWRGLDA